jgi:SAM-dependent methyltransferase
MITLTYENIDYMIYWNDPLNLKNYVSCQHGFDPKSSDNVFFQRLTKTMQAYCDKYLQFIPVNSKKIISVGSGASTFELILSKYCIDAKIFLLDKSELNTTTEGKEKSFSENNNHGFYNSWEVVHDAIKTSNLNKDSFIFLDPADEWETNMDVVISVSSWCWQFPFEFYADKLLKSLKIGGTLILEIQNPPDLRDVPKMISELLGSDPTHQIRYNILDDQYDRSRRNVDSDNNFGGFYVWTRKK